MLRQNAPPDPELMFGLSRPVPPVVQPRRREVEHEPDEPVPALAPIVSRVAVAEEFSFPPPQAAADVTPPSSRSGALWPAPVPTYTYLAGAAGSGKTFATKEWADEAEGLVLCATTGIAAINLGGETINSVIGFFDTASLQEMYITGALTAKLGRLWKCGVKRLIIDEVSMLSGDQLGFLVKAVEEVNNRGYVINTKVKGEEDGPPPQMGLTLVGDFCQLPPVKAPFAFEAPEWTYFAGHIRTLTEIRRQADVEFIQMLRAARRGEGKTVAEYFLDRNLIQQESDDHFAGATILAKNESVERYNTLRMQQLTGAAVTFGSSRWGKQRSEWGNPEKPPSTWGIPETLGLKIGALVMILANRRESLDPDDPRAKRLIYVNGDLGELVGAGEEVSHYLPGGTAVRKRVAYVRLQRTGVVVNVFPVDRLVKIPCDSARRKELRELGQEERIDDKWEVAGAITYMPLRVAYATTVHKSQGLSLDTVQVNVRDPFFKAPGMLYVALSRARTPQGLRLVGSRAALVERTTSHHKLTEWL